MSSIIQNLEKLLQQGRDTALVRYSLGNEYFKLGQFDAAISHLRVALQTDPDYSAAWKLLGKALSEDGQQQAALDAYRQGIQVAEAKGDKQAAKEMAVFAKRIEKILASDAGA